MPLEHRLGRVLPYSVARLGLRLLQPEKYRRYVGMRDPKLRPFFQTRSIFIHIPKCAGTSVVQALFGQAVANHRSVATMRIIFSREEYQSFYKFTFVRNPWDRLVSTYYYLGAGGQSAADRAWAEKLIAPRATFKHLVMDGLSEHMIMTAYHFRPQWSFLSLGPDRPIEMDFIGRFETIGQDFDHICGHLGVTSSLPRTNRGQARPNSYRDEYDDEMLEKVAQIYGRDIETFGYTF